MEDKILKLTKLWYEYVGMDHHKDRDCHWYINQVWSYGDEPYYRIEHYGYVYAKENLKHYKSYEKAAKALYSEIQKALMQELVWAKEIVSNRNMYDQIQAEKAEWLIKNYKEA